MYLQEGIAIISRVKPEKNQSSVSFDDKPKLYVAFFDLHAFSIFSSRPQERRAFLLKEGEKLLAKWNGQTATGNSSHKRHPFQASYVIDEQQKRNTNVTIRGKSSSKLETSQLCLNLSTHAFTHKTKSEAKPRMTLGHIDVNIKMRSTMIKSKSKEQEGNALKYNGWGASFPLPMLLEMLTSREMKIQGIRARAYYDAALKGLEIVEDPASHYLANYTKNDKKKGANQDSEFHGDNKRLREDFPVNENVSPVEDSDEEDI